MRVRLTFDPFVKEEIDRVRKVVSALSEVIKIEVSDLESVTTPNMKSVSGRHDRFGRYYSHWLEKLQAPAAQEAMSLIDQILGFLNETDVVRKRGMEFRPRYYKNYITLQHGNPSRNFVFLKFFPKSNFLIMEIKIHQSADIDQLITNAAGAIKFGYDKKGSGWYRVSLTDKKIEENKAILKQLINMSFHQHIS